MRGSMCAFSLFQADVKTFKKQRLRRATLKRSKSNVSAPKAAENMAISKIYAYVPNPIKTLNLNPSVSAARIELSDCFW